MGKINGRALGVIIAKATAEQMLEALDAALAEYHVKVPAEFWPGLARHLREVGERDEAAESGGGPE
jgi:hypothetical protein